MCKIKCPQFIKNSRKIRTKIVDKKCRKQHVLNFCCGKFTECKLCKGGKK